MYTDFNKVAPQGFRHQVDGSVISFDPLKKGLELENDGQNNTAENVITHEEPNGMN